MAAALNSAPLSLTLTLWWYERVMCMCSFFDCAQNLYGSDNSVIEKNIRPLIENQARATCS